MTNISNECGLVLNCVLTTGEGAGHEDLCQGIVKRYQDAGEPEPEVIYVDRDCCSETGTVYLVYSLLLFYLSMIVFCILYILYYVAEGSYNTHFILQPCWIVIIKTTVIMFAL